MDDEPDDDLIRDVYAGFGFAYYQSECLHRELCMILAWSGVPSRDHFTRAMLDEMNAQHAKEHADCPRAETLTLLQTGAAMAFAVVQGLTDDQLATSGTVFTDAPPMTAEQLIRLGLLGHIDDHMGSIRKTVGS